MQTDDTTSGGASDRASDRTGPDGHGPRSEPSAWLRLLGIVTVAGLVAVGCFATDDAGGDGYDDDYMDDPPPPGGCDTECPSPGSDGNPAGGPCTDSTDCMTGTVCSAQFDGEVQSFECQDACVPLMDDGQWCADDSSCCTPGAICSARGFCLVPGDTEGLDSGSDDTGSSGSGTDSGGTSEGTTDTGSSGSSSGSAGSSSTG